MIKSISKRSVCLLILDLSAILAAYKVAEHLKYPGSEDNRVFLTLALVVFPMLFYIFDFYHPFKRYQKYRTFVDASLCVLIGGGILAAAAYLDRTLVLPRFLFVYMLILLAGLVYSIRAMYDWMFSNMIENKRTVILGVGDSAGETARFVRTTVHSGLEVVGFISDKKQETRKTMAQLPILGSAENLVKLVRTHQIQLVILAMEPREEGYVAPTLGEAFKKDISVVSAIQLFENLKLELPYRLLSNHYLVSLMTRVNRRPYLKIKRTMDIIISLALIVLLLPLLIIVIIPITLLERESPFYVQWRLGKGGKPFKLYKLKSMRAKKRNVIEVTPIGRWLRQYRIDEIPQLLNVLRGEMSLIGPRPEIEYFTSRSKKNIPFYEAVFALKPGLTGWAQVMFRHATSKKDYEHKFRYNLYYLKNISFALDLLILLKTIRVVLLGRGK